MATTLADIRATNWQLSRNQIGEVVTGIDDIRQSIGIILTTTKGSLPLEPLFGSDIWRFIDTPVNTAAANISAEIIDAVTKWEPRILINAINYTIVGSRIDFVMNITLIQSSETTDVLFFIDRQNQIDLPPMGRAFSNGFDFGFS